MKKTGIEILVEDSIKSYIEPLKEQILKLQTGLKKLSKSTTRPLQLFTKEQVYKMVANFALSVDTGVFCNGSETIDKIVEKLKEYNYIDFNEKEKQDKSIEK